MLTIRRFIFNPFEENCWVASSGNGDAVIVDPAFYCLEERNTLFGAIEGAGLKVKAIFLTHGHIDHIYGLKDCQTHFSGVPAYLSAKDLEVAAKHRESMLRYGFKGVDLSFDSRDISDGQTLNLLGCEWKVISTPGHSPGSVCWYCVGEKILFSGDTLFAGAIGRSDLYGGDYDCEIRSLMEKIIPLEGDTKVYPGHGESTDIATERSTNPFLLPFNEAGEDGSVDGISF